ncbi:MAG: hypothetical protein K5891_07690 [Lachnospiraceae bacterium]|nr:hypothetical protein [Lachnospiraceae bacterium]
MDSIKKNLWLIITLAVLIVFVAIPLPPSDLLLRITYEDPGTGAMQLYYGTDANPGLSDAQSVTGVISPEEQCITFRLDRSLAGHLTALRFDFPHTDQMIVLKDVALSSGGTVQKSYLSCDFFSETRCTELRNVHIDRVPAQSETVFVTTADDPYFFFSQEALQELQGCYSSRRGTRLFVALLVLAGILLARRKVFPDGAPQ